MKKLFYLIIVIHMVACSGKGNADPAPNKPVVIESTAFKCLTEKFQGIKITNSSITKEEQITLIKELARVKIQCHPLETEWKSFLAILENGE